MGFTQIDLNKYVTTVVKDVRTLTPRIRMLELADPDDWELPPFTPGAHIDLVLTPDLIRQYSLCSDPADKKRYRVAVLIEAKGRGGSLHVHDKLAVGDIVPVSLPRNLFKMARESSFSILIAGGIGLTPFMAMIPELMKKKAAFHLHVCTRSREQTPFLAEIEVLQRQGFVTFHNDGGDPSKGLNLSAVFKDYHAGTHAYCCGPAALLDGFIAATAHWPTEAVHFERFSGVPAAGRAYSLELARSKRSLEVLEGETMATALKRNGVDVKTSCEAGICGICKIGYIAGDPDHRDHALTAEDRKHCIMPCVSGSLGTTLVLDL